MNTVAEEEEMNSSNKEISTVDVNVETVSKFEDQPMSKNSAIMKNSILPELDHEFANEAELMNKMSPDRQPNLSYMDNYNTNPHKLQEPMKRRFNSVDKNDNDGPSFLEEPQDIFLVRNKPSTLKCTAKNALNAWFECSSGDPDSLQNESKQIGNYVDPQTGIRTIEIHIEVSRQNLEDHVKRINDIQTNYKFNGQEAEKAKNSRNKQFLKNTVLDDQANDVSELPLVKSEQTAAHPDLQLTKLLNNVRLNETTTISPTSSPLNASVTNSQLSSLSSLIALMKSNEIYNFQCWCKSFGQHRTVESRKATIQLSYLNKHFKEEPNSKIGRLNGQIEIKCNPPEGYPTPEVVWLKNGLQINFSRDEKRSRKRKNRSTTRKPNKSRLSDPSHRHFNYLNSSQNKRIDSMVNDSASNKSAIVHKSQENFIKNSDLSKDQNSQENLSDLESDADIDQLIRVDKRLFGSDDEIDLNIPNNIQTVNEDLNSSTANFIMMPDHSLRIRSFRREDQANYTCVAVNASGRRYSRTITLKVNGGWSDWTEWSECNTKCGRGTQRRFRYCNNPPPINDGLKCEGDSVQTNECFVPCSNHNHHWSQWGQWSTCSIDCKQVRSRQCKVKETSGLLNSYSDGCQGQDVESKPCTGGLCRKMDRNSNKEYGKDHFGSSIQGLNQLLHQLNNVPTSSNNVLDRTLDRTLDRNQANSPLLPNYGNANQLPNNQPSTPSNVQNSDQQQIFVLCSLLATSLFFLLLLILFILFKQRKRHFKKNKGTILQLDQLGSEEQQQMLLLMQQTQTSSLTRTNQPTQILINANNRGYLQQPPSNQPTSQPDLVRPEKMHLITRLNQGTMIDHLLVRNDSLQQQSNKRISPLNTMNNQSAISNSNVSSSITTGSVNSNPSHHSSADEDYHLNNASNHTPKYNRGHFETAKSTFANKFNKSHNFNSGHSNNLNNKFNSPNKYLLNNRRQDSNYAFKVEEPDYAEPMLQSLQSSTGDLEKFGASKECKQSINSQSNSSNRSPSDSDNYDNYDQFEHYDQYYDQCEKYENTNYSFKNKNTDNYKNESQFEEYVESDNLLGNGEQQDGYDSLDQTNRGPPLPKTLPPSSYTLQQRLPYSPAKYNHHTLSYATDGLNNNNTSNNNLTMTNALHSQPKRTNFFTSTNSHLANGLTNRNSNRKMQFSNANKSSSTNSNNSNASMGTNSINKFIEVS